MDKTEWWLGCRLRWGVAGMALLGTLPAMAGLVIERFLAAEVEVRQGNDFVYLPAEQIGTPPVDVLEVDGRNFLKVRDREGAVRWVNKGDVVTSDLKAMRTNCQGHTRAASADAELLSPRGVGEKCDQ